ncbi:hypothetical protein CK203_099546 [Vitis vinifera]|uniref:Uncharacterized protein n=1 Tax=Vitis vinifera TaxID=29760 RepID=A0A438CJ29_VITVI|nr:hypothetical protein CK203_099546 [Vitis vinifera]
MDSVNREPLTSQAVWVPDMKYPEKVERRPNPDVRYPDEVGCRPDRIAAVIYSEKVGCRPDRIAAVIYPGGMSDATCRKEERDTWHILGRIPQ